MPQMREAMMIAGSIAALGGGLEAQPLDAHPVSPIHELTHRRMEPITAQVEIFDPLTNSFDEKAPTDRSLQVSEECSDSTSDQVRLMPYQYSPQSLGKCAVGDKLAISVSVQLDSNLSLEHLRTERFTVHKRPIHAVFLAKLTGDNSGATPPDNYGTDPGSSDNPPDDGDGPDFPSNPPNNLDPNPEPTPGPTGNPPVNNPPTGDGPLPQPSFTLATTYFNTLNPGDAVAATNGTVEIGQRVQWLTVINNDGEVAETVNVSDTPPAGETFADETPKTFDDGLPEDATIDPVTGMASWTIPDLEPGDSATYLTQTLAGPDKPCGNGFNVVEATAVLGKFGEDANFDGLDLGSTSNDGVVCNPDRSITPPSSMK